MMPGQVVHLDVLRNGEKIKKDVTLAARPSEKEAKGGFGSQGGGQSNGTNALDGVTVENLTPEIAQQVGVPASTKGVVVDSVDADSPAADAQPPLERGDVITQVNRQPVANENDYNRLINQGKGKSVLLYVNHQGSNIFVVVPSK
jgi:serine protease Do